MRTHAYVRHLTVVQEFLAGGRDEQDLPQVDRQIIADVRSGNLSGNKLLKTLERADQKEPLDDE